jgi:hypothetical protein
MIGQARLWELPAIRRQVRARRYDALVTLGGLAATDAACLGVPTHYVTNSKATMAGGAPEKVVTNGKGVEHFPDVYGEQLLQASGTVFATGETLDCTG